MEFEEKSKVLTLETGDRLLAVTGTGCPVRRSGCFDGGHGGTLEGALS